MNKKPELIFNISATKVDNFGYDVDNQILLNEIPADDLFTIVLSTLKRVCKANKINFIEELMLNEELSDKKSLKEISKLEKKLKKMKGNINEEM